MSVTPITDIETIIATAFATALSGVGVAAYYRLAPQGTALPYVVYQPQDAYRPRDVVGNRFGSALILVKALHSTASGARSLLATAHTGIAAGLTYSGYTLAANYEQSPVLPWDGTVYQSGHIYRVTVTT